ncbi:MAG: cyclodeaminase/cyclohydrolase family protein [Coriobacteriales bacterium]|jgi:formiminotetrahydrofolate cyclodeaminase|nr:cyclodeaminase/cyclohydrolase family protein [Coriobacteriales bacterium]
MVNATLAEQGIGSFMRELASSAPVPGGGSASAITGAIGMALGAMVGSLTVGKPAYAEVEQEVMSLNELANALIDRLLALGQRDTEVFVPLARAYGLPKETEEQRAHKSAVMESCLVECCAVPLDIMRACSEAIDLHERYARVGSELAMSDVGCGVICCKASMEAASLNVFINTAAMTDKARAALVNAEAESLLAEYRLKADAVFAGVTRRYVS